MPIVFVHNDKFMDDIVCQNETQNLARFLFDHQEFLKRAADAVWRSRTVEQFDEWKTTFMTFIVRAETRKAKRRLMIRLTSLLDGAYGLARTPQKGITKQDYLGKIRGGILELLVTYFVQSRYSNVDTNCEVYLNGRLVGSKTFDVAGVDSLTKCGQGELYECKVSGAFIQANHVQSIEMARRRLREARLHKVVVSLISFESRVNVRRVLRELGFDHHKLLTFEDLHCLRDYSEIRQRIA